MKILYVAGNRYGANEQLIRFLANAKDHKVAVAAFVKSSFSLAHVNWLLDPLYININFSPPQMTKLLGFPGCPHVNSESFATLLSEVSDFAPDLIISDGESSVAYIAKALEIPLWYCTPILLFNGLIKDEITFRYLSLFENLRKQVENWPQGSKYFIYSPFGDIDNPPSLKEGYEWVSPFYSLCEEEEVDNDLLCVINSSDRFSSLSRLINAIDYKCILYSQFNAEMERVRHVKSVDYLKGLSRSKTLFSIGESSFIGDAMVAGKNIIVSPSLNDPEALSNAVLVNHYGYGKDVAQIEYMERFAPDILDKNIKRLSLKPKIVKKNKNLIERIAECNM